MSEPAVHLPDVTRHAILMARAMTLGLRAWSLYPPEHPALGLAARRLQTVVRATVGSARDAAVHALVTLHDAARRIYTQAMSGGEHHFKMDWSGYPENVGSRKLNLCTMVVTVVHVFDALRSNRVYRQGMATDRIKAIMQQQDRSAFNRTLPRRFVNMTGPYPIGTLVRLNTGEPGMVTREHPDDPFRPQIKLVTDTLGQPLEAPVLANTWERDDRGDYPLAVVEAVDPEAAGIDPLNYLDQHGSEQSR